MFNWTYQLRPTKKTKKKCQQRKQWRQVEPFECWDRGEAKRAEQRNNKEANTLTSYTETQRKIKRAYFITNYNVRYASKMQKHLHTCQPWNKGRPGEVKSFHVKTRGWNTPAENNITSKFLHICSLLQKAFWECVRAQWAADKSTFLLL